MILHWRVLLEAPGVRVVVVNRAFGASAGVSALEVSILTPARSACLHHERLCI